MKVQEISWWEIGLAWVAASFFGICAGVAAGGFVNETIWNIGSRPSGGDSFITNPVERMLVIGLCLGFCVGISEWFVLPQLSPWWILASTVGWGVGLLSAEKIGGLVEFRGVILGTIIGIVEWFLFRRYVPAAYWWIPAHALGGLAFALVGWLPPNLMAGNLLASPLSYAELGIATGSFTAIALVWLSRLPFDLRKLDEDQTG